MNAHRTGRETRWIKDPAAPKEPIMLGGGGGGVGGGGGGGGEYNRRGEAESADASKLAQERFDAESTHKRIVSTGERLTVPEPRGGGRGSATGRYGVTQLFGPSKVHQGRELLKRQHRGGTEINPEKAVKLGDSDKRI